jgi:imidazolonepropionase-like amidohydrolase
MHRHQSHEFVIRAEAMAPFEVIRSATIVNAELLNRSGELGDRRARRARRSDRPSTAIR